MARSLPLTVVQAVFDQNTTKAFFVLVTLSHPDFATLRVVNNTQAITSNGDVFLPFPFSVILPPDTEELQVRAQLIMYDVERTIIDNLRAMVGKRTRIAVSLQVIESDDPDTVLQTVSGLVVENVQYSADQLNVDLNIDSLIAEGFPRDSFSPANFPGIF